MSGEQTPARSGCIGALVIFGGLFAVLVACNAITGAGETDQAELDEVEAISQCEGFADKRLKAPASADYDLEATRTGPDIWEVSGTVDAENSFGAQIRSEVRCVIRFDGDRAYLDEITID